MKIMEIFLDDNNHLVLIYIIIHIGILVIRGGG